MKKSILFIAALILNPAFLIFNCSAQYTDIFDFTGANGSNPVGSLISDGVFLYGTTYSGGKNDYGIIFKIKPDGKGYSKLLDFDKTKGSYPSGSLIFDGKFLYGMTNRGGTNDDGTIFKIKSDGKGYSKLFDFGPHSGSNAGGPIGSLISDGTFLYGMTDYGGTSFYCGTIFKIKPDGTGYTTLLNFTEENGSHPNGSLITDGTFLYGMSSRGGTNILHGGGSGTIFKIKCNGTGYSKLHDFNVANDGANPYGSLISDGTFLYGTTSLYDNTQQGGEITPGTFFKIKPDGTDYTKLLDFASKNCLFPNGSLISTGSFLFGTIFLGGTNNLGSIIKIKPSEIGYAKLLDFKGSLAGSPVSDRTFSVWNNGANYYYNIKQITAKTKQPATQENKGLYFQNDSLAKVLVKVKSESKDVFVAENIMPGEIIQYLQKVAVLSINQQAEEYCIARKKKLEYYNAMNWSAIKEFNDSISVKSLVFKYLIANRAKFYTLYTADTVDMIIKDIYDCAINRCLSGWSDLDTIGYKVLRAELIALKIPSADKLILGSDKFLEYQILSGDLYIYEKAKNWQQYAKTAIPLMDKHYMNNPNINIPDTLKALMDDMTRFNATAMDEQIRSKALTWSHTVEMLNHVSWTFYEKITDKQMLEKALVWSKKAIELDGNDPAIIDTYACLLFKTARKKEAIKTEEKALEIINKIPYFQGDRNAYEEKLAEFRK